VQLYRYLVSQSSELCRHNPLCCFSTSVYFCCLFRFRLSPETFGYILVHGQKCAVGYRRIPVPRQLNTTHISSPVLVLFSSCNSTWNLYMKFPIEILSVFIVSSSLRSRSLSYFMRGTNMETLWISCNYLQPYNVHTDFNLTAKNVWRYLRNGRNIMYRKWRWMLEQVTVIYGNVLSIRFSLVMAKRATKISVGSTVVRLKFEPATSGIQTTVPPPSIVRFFYWEWDVSQVATVIDSGMEELHQSIDLGRPW
jgi:hypothetical protein